MTTVDPKPLPVVESLGWCYAEGGWCVVLLKTQGDKVLERDILSGPEPFTVAWERLKVDLVKHLYRGASRLKA